MRFQFRCHKETLRDLLPRVTESLELVTQFNDYSDVVL